MIPVGQPQLYAAIAARIRLTPVNEDVLRERLAEAPAPEADRLRELTGQRFAGWSLQPARRADWAR